MAMTASDIGIMITGIICCSLGVLFAVSIFCFNIRFKNLRFVKMTSPKVNILLIFGALCIYGGSLLMSLPSYILTLQIQSAVYQSTIWLITVGFTLTFGSMLVKGWRVNRLFQYPRSNSLTIKDSSLFGAIFVLVLLDISILLSWQIVDPITCHSDNDVISCSSRFYKIWMITLLVYKYLIIAVCCIIGWQIRHITFPALDDSRCLLIGSGMTLALIGAVAAITTLFSSQQSAVLSVASILVWLWTSAILIAIFLPKMLVVLKAKGLEPLLCSASKYVQQQASNDIGTELLRILGENRYLKRKLEERDTLVSHLKKQLSATLNIDCVSQQTSSGNYSVASGATSTSSHDSSQLKCSNLLLTCCYSSADSTQAQRGSPLELNETKITALNILTAEPIESEQCYTIKPIQRCNSNSSADIDETINSLQMPAITISHAAVTESSKPTQQSTSSHEISAVGVMQASTPAASTIENQYGTHANDDLDLICSIADTYDLGEDSDTYSFISNCLYKDIVLSSSYTSARKHTRSRRLSLNHTVSTLGSDQLYPESLKPPSRSKRHRMRRQSHHQITTTNIYTTNNGKPLIL